MEIKR